MYDVFFSEHMKNTKQKNIYGEHNMKKQKTNKKIQKIFTKTKQNKQSKKLKTHCEKITKGTNE